MREDDLRASDNVEDRRGRGPGVVRGGGIGIGAIVVLSLLGWALGIDPSVLIGGAQMVAGGGNAPVTAQPDSGQRGAPTDAMGNFVARVLGETEDVWSDVLPRQAGRQYEKPVLVLFSGVTQSGCGTAQSAMGPFYCPLDRKLYLDTAFFRDMQSRLGGGGDFAYAYVIAHEVGHHVQNLLGILPKVQKAQAAARDEASANAISVRVELMADCFAGVWANQMNQRHKNIDENDVRAGINTATAIGDDRLGKRSGGVVVPDSFTHGSSEQRVGWLMTGMKTGSVQACDTFQSSAPGRQ